MVSQAKPNPEIILKVLNHFNIKKKYAILIGDSLKDFFAANDAGIKAILVDWGLSKLEIKNYNVLVVNNTNSLKKKIDEHFVFLK